MPKFHLQQFTFVKSHNSRTIKQTDSVNYKVLLPKHKMQMVAKHQWERSWWNTGLARATTTDFTLQVCTTQIAISFGLCSSYQFQ